RSCGVANAGSLSRDGERFLAKWETKDTVIKVSLWDTTTGLMIKEADIKKELGHLDTSPTRRHYYKYEMRWRYDIQLRTLAGVTIQHDEEYKLCYHKFDNYTTALSGDGRILANCRDNQIRIWNTHEGIMQHKYPTQRFIVCAALNTRGNRLATLD